VLQASHTEAPIRYAVTAIAALTKTLQRAPPSSSRIDCQTRKDEHHKFALQQYAKAISGLRELIARKENALRTALIACLLFVCIESLQGNQTAASQQVHGGLSLMQQVQRQRLKKDERENQAFVEEELVQMWAAQNVQNYYLVVGHVALIRPCCHRSYRNPKGMSSVALCRVSSVPSAKRNARLICSLMQLHSSTITVPPLPPLLPVASPNPITLILSSLLPTLQVSPKHTLTTKHAPNNGPQPSNASSTTPRLPHTPNPQSQP
jgi:hypothetical protein